TGGDCLGRLSRSPGAPRLSLRAALPAGFRSWFLPGQTSLDFRDGHVGPFENCGDLAAELPVGGGMEPAFHSVPVAFRSTTLCVVAPRFWGCFHFAPVILRYVPSVN